MIEPSYTFSKLDSLSGTGNFFSGSIYWVRTSYQFTKELDLRLVTQYDGFERQLLVDPLLTYRINPFTSFFIGSSHDFLSNENSGVFHATGRQFFAKLQYLIQT
jgi:hypothetical protein